MKDRITALALFSGGLDSILACRVVAEQGVRVIAVKFVTPFFDYDLLEDEEEYRRKVKEKYDIDVIVRDITASYLELLHNPPHGFGKHFNPCIDCKIMMISDAKKLLEMYGATFIITGEVIGQRPMSQRRDTLRVIERDSDTDSLLLRPLCAKSQKPTAVELAGIIDREKLPEFSGRGRAGQIELAARLGITDYPNAAGGCKLTDPNLAKRIRGLYGETSEINSQDIRFLLVGRQFRMPNGGWLAMGRDEKENNAVLKLKQPEDIVLRLHDRPGPIGLLRHSRHLDDIRTSAALLARYAKKINGKPVESQALIVDGESESIITAAPLFEEEIDGLLVL
ncbi:MAG: thiamine biosynthesis protein [Pseudomonadota bacterium]